MFSVFFISEFLEQSQGHEHHGVCGAYRAVLPDDLCVPTACIHLQAAVHEHLVRIHLAQVFTARS